MAKFCRRLLLFISTGLNLRSFFFLHTLYINNSFSHLEVYSVHVVEEERQETTVVHLLAELSQEDVTLLLTVAPRQDDGDAGQVLAHVLLRLLLLLPVPALLQHQQRVLQHPHQLHRTLGRLAEQWHLDYQVQCRLWSHNTSIVKMSSSVYSENDDKLYQLNKC